MIRTAASFALLAAFATEVRAGDVTCEPDIAFLQTREGNVTISVEIADDDASRARGLMYREALEPMSGMLFVYPSARTVSFWMENTPLSLDMIFLDEAGVVRHIHPFAKPFDRTPVPGAAPEDRSPERLMVLELAGGEARRLGIVNGTLLAHPALPQESAALPCP